MSADASAFSAAASCSPAWDEQERAAALGRYAILDTPTEAQFDDIASLAADGLSAPIAVVNFVATERQWFKAEIGIGQRELPIDVSICRHAILQPDLFVVPDLRADSRFRQNPLIHVQDGLRFYAGAPLLTPEGLPIGTVCVLDRTPRPEGLSAAEARILRVLARHVMAELELRRALAEREAQLARQREATEAATRASALLQAIGEASPIPTYAKDRQGRTIYANAALLRELGKPLEAVLGRTNRELAPADAATYDDNDARVLETGEALAAEETFTDGQGRRTVWRTTKAPLKNADGEVIGLAGVSVDLTTERNQLAQLEEARQLLAGILQASPDPIFAKDADGAYLFANRATAAAFGDPERDLVGVRAAELFSPEAFAAVQAHDARVLAGETIVGEEAPSSRDGVERAYMVKKVPLRTAEGEVRGVVAVARDISALKASERRQELLLDELNHRVKNTLALVQNVARQSLKSVPADIRAGFESRIIALANAHEVLTRHSWEAAFVEELVAAAIEPFLDNRDRLRASGPSMRLSARSAVAVTLVLHELATNASKYGALSADGRVDVSWWMARSGDGAIMKLLWVESGGPPVKPPTTSGFGSRLIAGIARESGGEARLEYRPTGVFCEIIVPLPYGRPEQAHAVADLTAGAALN
ncbi:PAS domain-containing protein [Phenylobacterium sp.]|uniref:PAS domain-containing protein n=1 Tax=Phenylobacterium sp. TaxID=1871053 RepID=UPI002F958356